MFVLELRSLTPTAPNAADRVNHLAGDNEGDKFRGAGSCLMTPVSVSKIGEMNAGSALPEPDRMDQRLQLG